MVYNIGYKGLAENMKNEEADILKSIYTSALKFLSPLSMEETCKVVLEEGKKIIRAKYGSIFILSDNILKRYYSDVPKMMRVSPRRRGFVFKSLKTGAPFFLPANTMKKNHPELNKTLAKSDVIVPLTYEKKTLGVLSLVSAKEKVVNNRELDSLKIFGSMASLAIEKTRLYEETIKSLEARDLFISMASHELKTPLTTISSYVQILQRNLNYGREIKKEWVDFLLLETNRMGNLINELLHVDRINTGNSEFVLKECNIREILSQSLIEFRYLFPRHKFLFSNNLKNEPLIFGDREKLTQLFFNILGNAAKFSSINELISVKLSRLGNYYLIVVRDKGNGIKKDDLQRIFEKYYRGKNNRKEGMGLGLYLVKNIIKRHKGKIEINSKPGKGTRVKVFLPFIAKQDL